MERYRAGDPIDHPALVLSPEGRFLGGMIISKANFFIPEVNRVF